MNLTIERTILLEELGMTWDICAEKWNLGYTHAKNYRIGVGIVPVSHTYITEDGYPLDE